MNQKQSKDSCHPPMVVGLRAEGTGGGARGREGGGEVEGGEEGEGAELPEGDGPEGKAPAHEEVRDRPGRLSHRRPWGRGGVGCLPGRGGAWEAHLNAGLNGRAGVLG